MPRGDTVHRLVGRLGSVLQGRLILHAELGRVRGRVRGGGRMLRGDRVGEVRAVGEDLEIVFERGTVLRTRLGMSGSWWIYRAGQPWGRPAHRAAVVLTVPGWSVVCFGTRRVEIGHRDDRRPDQLGPDVLARAGHRAGDRDPGSDEEALLDRIVERTTRLADPAASIGEVLLDRTVAAGIGDVWRSEALFAEGVDPATPLGAVDPATRRRLYATARRLMGASPGGGHHRTGPGGLAVHGRAGRPCRRCGTTIRVRRLGPGARAVWWCPACQPPVTARSAPRT